MPPGRRWRGPGRAPGGEQVVLQAQGRLAGDDRERVGQGQQHEVVAPVGPLQERPAVVDVGRDPRVGVGAVGVAVAAQPLQCRVDLDRVDPPGPLASATATSLPVPAPMTSTSSRVPAGRCRRGRSRTARSVRGPSTGRAVWWGTLLTDTDRARSRRPLGGPDLVVRRPVVQPAQRLDAQEQDDHAQAGPLPAPRRGRRAGPRTRRQRPAPRRAAAAAGTTAPRRRRCRPGCRGCRAGRPPAARTGRRCGPPPGRWWP